MFVGEKLTDIRVLHGYSRNELANVLNVTEQSIWQYENGYATPGIETMNKIKQLFKVKTKFFYNEKPIGEIVKEEGIAYRSTEKNSIKKTRSEAVYLRFMNYLVDYIEEFVEYPENLITLLRDRAINKIIKEGHLSDELIKQLALDAREVLGLNNCDNQNLMFLMEKNGAYVIERTLNVETDAYSAWVNDHRPYIVLGNSKKSAVRRNFDLAHELGHLIMHYKVNILDLNRQEYERIEKEANLFASNFLLPEEQFLNDLKIIKRKSNPDSYIELKEKWHVSIAALAYRGYQLNELTYQQYRYFNGLLNKKQYKIREPLDDQISIVKPGKIRNSLKYIFENKLSDLEEIHRYSSFETEFISSLLNIEEEFFFDYLIKPRIFHFEKKA